MEDKKYTKDNLSKLGIFQLREIARDVGVHLPTTYKKDDLIEKIIQVASGQILPFVPKNKKGRPPKSVSQFGNVADSTVAQKTKTQFSWNLGDFLSPNAGISFVDELKVCMKDAVFYSKEENKPQKTLGVVFIEPNGMGAFHVGGLNHVLDGDIAYIPSEMIATYNIKTGDELLCNVFVNLEGNKVVDEVFEINKKPANSFKRLYDSNKNFDAIQTKEAIHFWEQKSLESLKNKKVIGKGQRVFVFADESTTGTKFLSEVSKFATKTLKTIIVALDKRPEEKTIYSQENAEFLFCNFDVTPFRQIYLLNLGIERAKRLCEMGEDVCLVIDNLVSVFSAYECFFEQSEESLKRAQIEIKKLLAVGINSEKGGTITLFAGTHKADDEMNKFFERLKCFCNSHIYLQTDASKNFVIKEESLTENFEDIK